MEGVGSPGNIRRNIYNRGSLLSLIALCLIKRSLTMTIEQRKVASLKGYEFNNKKHPERQVSALMKSISEFGFVNPVLIEEDGTIIAGHGRVAAAKRLQLEEVPCIRLSELTPTQAKAYRIADNKLATLGVDHIPNLQHELEEILNNSSIDAESLGYTLEEIELLQIEQIEKEVIEDEVPARKETAPAISKPGDIWFLGNHRLMIGDATVKEDAKRLLRGEEADLCVTEPPYNVAYEGGTEDKLKIMNDSMGNAEFYLFLLHAYQSMHAVMKKGASIYVFFANSEVVNFTSAFKKAGFKWSQEIKWKKNTFVLGRADYHHIYEPCIYGWKEGAPHAWYGGRKQHNSLEFQEDLSTKSKKELLEILGNILHNNPSDVIEINKPTRNGEHPTMKPVKLIAKLIENSTTSQGLVVDLFAGSGTTLIAAEQLGRRSAVMELDPHYGDVIIKRYLKYMQDFGGGAPLTLKVERVGAIEDVDTWIAMQ